jgi:tRNA modification GTPase
VTPILEAPAAASRPGGGDTIVAIASPPGRGAVGVIRLSGSDVPRIAAEVLGEVPVPRVARLARFKDLDGATLDQGLALFFPAPASFTGEHVLELQGHGGAVILDLLLQRLLALGARLARPGEFSERAFLNGKMDVAQAEAVADLIDAGTATAARAAARSMQGEFSIRVAALQAALVELRTQVEAAIDFPDEDIDVAANTALRARLASVADAFESIESAARQGAMLRDGLTVVIAGKPNAGKSSLLNRLVGEDAAIVADLPGTTRDVLRHFVELDGLPLTLIDTAGLRAAADPVEAEGIRRARVEMQRADRLLYVVDASLGETEGEVPSRPAGVPAEIPLTLVVNKIDLIGASARLVECGSMTTIYVSARTGEGQDLVRAHLKQSAGYAGDAGALSARRRHLDALARAHALLQRAALALDQSELFAEELRLAHRALGEITGEFTSDDLLGEIFGSFCIGK